MVTYGTPASRAAERATTIIPIVIIGIGDPVRSGLVQSFARPGGNLTGNTILGPDIAAKPLQLLQDTVPKVSRLAFLWNPDNASNVAQFEEVKSVIPALNMRLIPVAVRRSAEFDSGFAAMLDERPDAFAMTNDAFHQYHIGRIIDFLE